MAALFLSSPKQPLSPPLVGSGRPITTTTITFLKTRSPRNQNQKPLSTIAFSASSSSSFRNENTPPEAECPVPLDQQPVNEYQSLSTSFPFSWASGDIRDYCSRLFFTGSAFAHFVGLPIACLGVVNPESQPLMCVFGAVSSGILVVTLAVLRMYLGWAYVGNRLLSATVEYEETGWYDGQIWVKTDEILARDRLLGSFSVKPVLSRLKFTLVGLAVSLVICVLILISTESSRKDQGNYIASEEAGGRVVAGVYNEESARSFEPDAFCGGPGVP